MDAPRTSVLFVCYANICRSPLAEGTFRWLAERRGLLDRLTIDSAGTSAMDGAPPHTLSQAIAGEQGFMLEGESRQLVRDDLSRFDHVIVMDRQNLATIQRLTGSAFGVQAGFRARVRLLREIADPRASGTDLDVPDPIGRGPDHYRAVFTMIERGCSALLDELFPGS
ncbi:low molecular weight protein-tyrosine-phosphatase [Nannocystaceae bacterium ST9]